MNLFASLKEALTEGVISQIAAQNNEKPEKIQKAVDALSASLVGGLIKRVATESGMKLVFTQVQKIEFAPDQFGKIFKNPTEFSEFKSVGEKILNTVLPGLKSPVCSMVTKYSGTQNSLASLLSGITVAVIMTVLKKKTTEKQLDAESLAAYLGDQRENLLTVVPDLNDKLIETVGIQYLLQSFAVPRAEHSGTITKGGDSIASSQPFLVGMEVEETGFNRANLKWVGIGLAVVAMIAVGIYFWNQNKSSAADVEGETTDSLSEARTVQEPIAKTPTTKDTLTAATPTPPPSSASPMATYLADNVAVKGKAFKFENVDFENNTTQLKATSTQAVQELADLLKKYPNAQIKLVGYANDAQAPLTNKTLSVKRVFALKDAFVKAGISYIRVDAEGRGTGINPKDTTGRKQVAMREVWVKFVQK